MSRKCLNHPDTFCYVCGELKSKSQRRNFTPLIKKCYELYFCCRVGEKDEIWAPQYTKYNWNICRDLNVIAVLLGSQLGCTTLCCFLREWDSRDRKITTFNNSGLKEKRLFEDRKM